jgi:hypothetical protein
MLTAYRPEELKKTKLLGIQVTPSQHERFGDAADRIGMTRSALGRKLVLEWLETQEDGDAK